MTVTWEDVARWGAAWDAEDSGTEGVTRYEHIARKVNESIQQAREQAIEECAKIADSFAAPAAVKLTGADIQARLAYIIGTEIRRARSRKEGETPAPGHP